MKKFKLISTMLSVSLLGSMFNFTVLADEPNVADATSRTVYEQNFDDCTWWEGETTPTADEFTETIFYWGATEGNVETVNELKAGMPGRESTDKSLRLGATFKHDYRKDNNGSNLVGNVDDWSFWPCDWGNPNTGNNGVSHKMSLPNNEAGENEKFWHVSFSAAQDPVPHEPIAGANGAGLDVSFIFNINEGDGNSHDVEVLRWCDENRRQTAFDMYYGAGVPNLKPMAAGNWINYDYVFNSETGTMDIYLNGYPVIKGKYMADKIQKDGNTVTPKGLGKLNFQVRDINVSGNSRSVNAYIDDIKVTYSATEPVISLQSVFGEKANIDAPEKYVDNERGVIYNYGQSLDDMKKYINAAGGNRNVYLVVEKWGSTTSNRWNEPTTSLGSIILEDTRVVNPVLCVEDDHFYYCYEVKQPQDAGISATMTDDNTLTFSNKSKNCQGIDIFKDGDFLARVNADAESYTDTSAKNGEMHAYTIRELLADNNISKFVIPSYADGTKVIFAENFDSRTWWEENGTTPTGEQFTRTPFYRELDTTDKMETSHKLETGKSGREADDKSLHINAKFKNLFGKKADGTDLPHGTEDGQWNGGFGDEEGISGNNGISHRMVVGSNDNAMTGDDRYLRVSFATVKDATDLGDIKGEQGAGFDVSFDFITDGEDANNKEMLHWYPDNKQGVFGKFYQVRARKDCWVYYDYVFDTQTHKMDIYVNGYPTIKGRVINNDGHENIVGKIRGVRKLNFQVRDMNTGADQREINVYVDDVRVAYSKDAPVISAYSIFGEDAKINDDGANGIFIDNEAGIIYNFGDKTFDDIKALLPETADDPNDSATTKVRLVREANDSLAAWQKLVDCDPETGLNPVKIDDGRNVSPILYVIDGYFTYRYRIAQPIHDYNTETRIAKIRCDKDYDNQTVIFAGYKDSVLVTVDYKTADLQQGENLIKADESFDTSNVDEIRVMAWDSITGMKPLYDCFQLREE